MTLTEFLLARIDADEEVARKALAERPNLASRAEFLAEHEISDSEAARRSAARTLPLYDTSTWLVGISPLRVLAECEAKRRIVDEHTCDCPDPDCRDCAACSGDHHADPTPAPCQTLRLLALPYAGHSDYDAAWSPEPGVSLAHE